jgi:hypothetical protein
MASDLSQLSAIIRARASPPQVTVSALVSIRPSAARPFERRRPSRRRTHVARDACDVPRQDGGRIEGGRRLATRTRLVDDRRRLAVRINRPAGDGRR